MGKESTKFSEKYDQLFEKPKLKVFEERKIKVLILLGVVVTGCVIVIPYLFLLVNEHIILNSQKKIDEIEASQPFTEVPIFKKNLAIQFPPDYQKASKYNLYFDGKKLDFGNGYALEMIGFSSVENKLTDYSLKPSEGYDSVTDVLIVKGTMNQWAIVNDGKKRMYDTANPFETETYTAVRVTGNLLKSMNMQKMKEKGSFLTLYQQENIGDVKTGIVINCSPYHGLSDELGEIPQSYVVLTKYWLFPDGVGIMVDMGNNYLGNLAEKDDFSTINNQKLKEIDAFTMNSYSWLDNHFQLERVQK
ncbi:hypothetical protein [Enterococcus faecalis]